MKTKSPYRKSCRISDGKIREIVRYFSLDLPAIKTTELTRLNPKTVDNWYGYIRKVLLWEMNRESDEMFSWTVELDETYCWPKRVKGKRWRWAGMKTIVFGLLKRDGKVYAEVVPDVKARTLKPIIRKKIAPDSEVNTDGWWAYDGLVDMGYAKHYRVHHGANEFARGNQHVNGIESFWSYLKRRFTMFNGVKKSYFHLYLQETVFRYNTRIQKKNLYKEILKLLRKFNSQS